MPKIPSEEANNQNKSSGGSLLRKNWLTNDEEYNAEGRIAELLQDALEKLKLDTYNNIYLVQVVVEKINKDTREDDD